MRRKKNYKRCPRCDRKIPLQEPKCYNCGLIFARLNKATNKAAKKALRRGEKNKVIYDNVLPRDMKKWKLVLITLFLGFVGGHQYYVGKVWRGVYTTVSFIMIVTAAFLPDVWWNDYWLSGVLWLLIMPYSFAFLFWIVSVIQVIANKYRVPISIDEELVLQEDYDSAIVSDVMKTVDKARKDKKDKGEKVKQEKVVEEKQQEIKKKIKVVCKNCGKKVKVEEDEKICPHCEDNLNGEN